MTKEEILDHLQKKYPIEEQVTFNEFDVQEKLQSQQKLTMYYWDLLQKATAKKDETENLLIDEKCKAYDKLKFENERNLTKTEIELFYLPADKNVKKAQRKLEILQIYVDFFKVCYDASKNLHWKIRTYLESREKM